MMLNNTCVVDKKKNAISNASPKFSITSVAATGDSCWVEHRVYVACGTL